MDFLTDFLTPEKMRVVLGVLKWLFFAMTLGFVAFALMANFRIRFFSARRRKLGLIPLFFAAALVVILAYQATWQLAGFTHKDLVRHMERHNPRTDNAAKNLIRGRILDCKGRVLAESDREARNFRRYPYGEATAHIVGFRHPTEGLNGLENALDGILSGYLTDQREGIKDAMLLALQREKERNVGSDVTLTIDAELQRFAYEAMNGRKGAVVGIDPRDGAIRVLLSTPSFDPNDYKRALNIDPDSPLLNRALHGRYPAGSTFKLAIAALALENGKAGSINCPAAGYKPPGGSTIRDHEYYAYQRQGLVWPGFGTIGLDEALAKSANTYFASAGVACGIDAYNDFAEKLKFNERFTLAKSEYGTVSSQLGSLKKLGRGERGELSQVSIGQGRMLATPLHMALLTAATANRGVAPYPRIIETDEPRVLSKMFEPATAVRLKTAMRKVVTDGTGKKANIPEFEIYGKTGTAQNPGGEDHAWFVCFAAPAGKPPLALAVIVENAGYGSAAALPVAVEVLKKYYENF